MTQKIFIVSITKDDAVKQGYIFLKRDFNPHPSREGWHCFSQNAISVCDFNPHPSYEGWLLYHSWQVLSMLFQSTSFTRRMTRKLGDVTYAEVFQSTSFIRRMTISTKKSNKKSHISIHILHTKDDLFLSSAFSLKRFQSTSFIRRMTPYHSCWSCSLWVFQSTSFIRRMTENRPPCAIFTHFNPHPSYEGWPMWLLTISQIWHFNPHPSYEGWRRRHGRRAYKTHFNPHPSYEGWLYYKNW